MNEKRIVEIKSLEDFISKIRELNSITWPNTNSDRIVYRGHSCASWRLAPSINRDVDNTCDKFIAHERELVESAVNKYPDTFGSIKIL